MTSARLLRARISALAALTGLLASMLALVAPLAPASATTACPATAGAAASNYSLTITALHGQIFYVDPKAGINSAYVGFKISNTGKASDLAIGDAWVEVYDFASNVKLANDADSLMQIGPISKSNSGVAYFYMKASAVSSSTQSFKVRVYDGRPDAVNSTCLMWNTNTFKRVDQTISANSNKVTSISVNTTTPQLGDTLVVTVNGVTGVGGSGDSTGDSDIMYLSPASAVDWPTRSLRLEETTICLKANSSSCTVGNYTNVLVVSNITSSPGKFTSKTSYTATYTFRVVAGAAEDPLVSPVAQIASGTQMKHTGSYPALPSRIKLTDVNTATFVINKNASTTLQTSAFCAGKSKAAVRYTITGTLQAPATSGTIDQVVDQPGAGAELDTTNSNVTVTDNANTSGTTWGSSKIVNESGKITFVGPFKATATRTVTIAYTMCIPWNATTSNSGYGVIGPTIVGFNSSKICAAAVTVGASGTTTATVSTSCDTAKPGLSQTITFDALPTVGVGDEVPLVATTSSGNPVTFSSATPAKCTVSQSGTTWKVTAVAVTDASNKCAVHADSAAANGYNAAATVSRDMTIRAGQTLVMSDPSTLANMNVTSTQDFTVKSMKSSDTSTATGLTVTVTSLSTSTCTVAGTGTVNRFRVTTLTPTASNPVVGTCYLVMSQSGGTGSDSVSYGPATNLEVSLNVGSTQTIDFEAIPAQTSTTSPATTFTARATAKNSAGSATNLKVDFNSATPSICTVGTETLTTGVTTAPVTKVAAGRCTLVASQEGSSTYSPAPDETQSVDIGSPQMITFAALTDVSYLTSTKSIEASTNSSLTISFTASPASVCTVSAGTRSGDTTPATVTRVAYGLCTITAKQSGDASWWAATDVSRSFYFLGSTSQTITFNQPTTPTNISAGVFAAPARASSNLPITYSSTNTSICTVTDDGTVTMKAIGNCEIAANQPGNTTYAPATEVKRTIALQATGEIGFSPDASVAITAGTVALASTHTYSVPATGASVNTGLMVTYTSNSTSICSVSGSTLTLVTTGSCSVTASQSGSGNVLASTSQTRSITISKATQTITFSTITNVTYSAGGSRQVTASATSKLQISFVSSDTDVCSVSSANVDGDGVTTVTINYVAAGSCQLTASQAGNDSYSAATSVIRSFTINKASQTISFGSLSAKTYGDSFSLSGLGTATSGLDVTWSVSGSCSLSSMTVTITAGTGSTTCKITANQSGNANYNAATAVEQTFTTNKRSITITANSAGKKKTISDDPTFTYSVTGDLAFDDAFSGSLARAKAADPDRNEEGRYAINQGTLTINNSARANAHLNYDITFVSADLVISLKDTPNLAWSNPTAITYGTSISDSTHLNAAASFGGSAVAGTKTYKLCTRTLSDGDVLDAGTYTFTVEFAPTDTTNYESASKSVSVVVNKKTISATLGTNSREYDGTKTFSPTASGITGKIRADDVAVEESDFTITTSSADVGEYVDATVALGSGKSGLKGTKAANYQLSVNSTTTATITRRLLSITSSGGNKTYDGTASTPLTFTLSNKIGSDDVSVDTSDVTGAYGDANAGTDKTITISKGKDTPGLTGAKSGNYRIEIPTEVTGTIAPKQLTATVSANNKEYDGSTSVSFSVTNLSGIVGSDDVSADTDDMTVAFTNANVGSDKTVNFGKKASGTGLGGTKAANYTLASGTTTASITAREIIVTADDITITSGGTPTFTWTVSRTGGDTALIGSDAIESLTKYYELTDGTTTSSTPTVAGTYKIKPSAATFSIGNASNYSITFKDGTFKINSSTKKSQTIDFDDVEEKTYGDTTFSVAASSTSNKPVRLSYVSGPCTLTDGVVTITGAGQCRLRGAEDGDDEWDSATGDQYITIKPKRLTFTGITVTEKVYDGNTTVTLSISGRSTSDRHGSDTSSDVDIDTVTASFDAAGTGNSVGVTVSGITLKGSNKDFYEAVVTGLAGKITPKPTTVTIANKEKEEGDSDPALTFTSSGFLGTDAASCTLTRQSGSAAGTYRITGTCTTSTNYTFSVIEGTFTIKARPTPEPEPQGDNSNNNSDNNTTPTGPTPEIVREKTSADARTRANTPVQVAVRGVDSGMRVVLTEAVKNLPNVKIGLDQTTGRLEVTPTNGWTGKITVPVLVEKEGKQVEVETLIVVNPGEPEKAKSDVKSAQNTVVMWEATPGAIRYQVDMDGRNVCSTSETSCTINDLVGPKTKIEVTAIGNDDTKSAPKASPYSADAPFSIKTLPFAVNKAVLTTLAKADLTRIANLVQAKGFTRLVIDGHTDSSWPKVNAALSKARAEAVVKYLSKVLPDVKFAIKGYAAKAPVASNTTKSGKAANRRAEIKLW